MTPEQRETEGLRRENSGLTAQRVAAITGRRVHGRWYPVYDGESFPVAMEWHWSGSRV